MTDPNPSERPFDSYEALRRLELIDARLPQLDAAAAGLQELASSPEARALRGVSERGALEAAERAIAGLPPRELGRAHAPLTTRIAIIADPFLVTSFEALADFLPVTPENYAETATQADVLLVASTWRGHDGACWRGVGTPGSRARRHLLDVVIPAFRRRGVPVVFYSKEDPPNYSWFVEVAAAADAVVTTAEEVVPHYRADCPDVQSVDVVPFGVNPLHHSPIGSRLRPVSSVFFAGSWHQDKYPERATWGRALLEGVRRSHRDLLVFDRNSELRSLSYMFPGPVLPFVHNAVPHAFLMDLQRVSDFALNLNSVIGSKTMYANRAIELQASGTVVISNYNLGLNSRFPHVHLANSAADVAGFIDSLTFDQQRTIQVRGIRDAFGSNLSLYGLDRILSTVGLSTPDRTLRAIAVADHADDRLRSQFAKQSIGPVEVVAPEHLERAANAAQANVVLDVTSHRDYGVNYALDHLNAYKYASTQQAGKLDGPAEAADARAHQYVDGTPAAGLGSRWVSADSADTHECSQSDYYGIDHFGSWPRGVRTVTVTAAHHAERPLLSVVVPIYNNGQHLKYKCIQSLRRSSLFEQMEIILVDDGSTDGATPATVKELAAQLPRAVHYRFRDGGSGSASRPRNKGLELATGEFVTYLDPDNEATEDGFAHLVELLRAHPEAEIAAGNMSRWSDSYRVSNNVAYLRQATGGAGEFVAVPQATLAKLKFRPVSIQALVARTDWLRDLHLVQPVGAAGQDSYFFQQVLFHTEKMALSDRVIHTYYAAVEDSTVNTVGARFFEKYLLLEIPRVAWLHEVGLFDAYAETRLEQYVRDWYLNKLDAVKPAERSDAVATLAKILALYADHQWREPRIRAFLAEHGV